MDLLHEQAVNNWVTACNLLVWFSYVQMHTNTHTDLECNTKKTCTQRVQKKNEALTEYSSQNESCQLRSHLNNLTNRTVPEKFVQVFFGGCCGQWFCCTSVMEGIWLLICLLQPRARKVCQTVWGDFLYRLVCMTYCWWVKVTFW